MQGELSSGVFSFLQQQMHLMLTEQVPWLE